MNYYKLNNIDITSYVIERPKIKMKMGRIANFSASKATLRVENNDNLFSPENTSSLLYPYRGNYREATVTIVDENDAISWYGVIDNITRDINGTVLIETTESIINLLEAKSFVYKTGDGYTNNQAFAGATATPAEHQLAFLRRYVDDTIIDVGSFLQVKEIQTGDSIQVDCSVSNTDDLKPIDFLKNLCLGISEIYIIENKIFLKSFQEFSGDYGYQIPNQRILKTSNIKKTNQQNVYSRYSIEWDNLGTPTTAEGSIGATGTTTDLTSTYLQDNTLGGDNLWSANEHRGKYVEVGTGGSKEILYINGNNKNTLFFENCTLSSPQTYLILNDNQIYSKDYSAYPIKLTSGIAAVGTSILTNQIGQKLTMQLTLSELFMFLRPGNIVTLTLQNEGIVAVPFVIDQVDIDIELSIIQITISDRILYPILEDWELTLPGTPENLEGYREINGSANLWWDSVSGVSYYRIYVGTSESNLLFSTVSQTNSVTISNIYRWAKYYFQVTAVNTIGTEGEGSNILQLDPLVQGLGYIDATDGPYWEHYAKWGLLEKFYYILTYKNVNAADIKFLSKSRLTTLDRSQSKTTEDVTQGWAVEFIGANEALEHRSLGYIDGAGTSDYLPEFNSSPTPRIKNSMSVKLTINGTTYAAGADIPGSEDWMVTDGNGNYMTYWFGTGYMMDIANDDCNEWFKVWKIDKTMGIFDHGFCSVSSLGIMTDTNQNWNVDQWEGYYVKLVNTTEIQKWYKISSNTATTLTIVVPSDFLYNGKYIINDVPYQGFDGVLVDDVWDSLYRNEINQSQTDSGIGEDVGDTWLQDTDKSWETDQWEGYYVKIESGSWILITGNDADELWFDANPDTGLNKSYVIRNKFYVDNGFTYGVAMASFLDLLRTHVENRSYDYNDNWVKAESGNIIINTWCDDFNVYSTYVNSVCARYQHYIMFEALQSSWDMSNEVTKQFYVYDWQHTIERWENMKKQGPAGYCKLMVLGYPHTHQMYLSLLIGTVMLSKYSDQIEDIGQGGNIVLTELYYDMLQAMNKNTRMTLGIPDSGYETSYISSDYDPYAICIRRLTGAIIFYNPHRKIQISSYTFPENATDYHTGNIADAGVQDISFLLPRSPNIFFRRSAIGKDASDFLSTYLPFSYIDSNAGWIVFTAAGKAAIGTNSVWIENGHSSYKRIVLDGSATIPTGTINKLFHAGDGSTTEVNAESHSYDPLIEGITGQATGGSVILTSDTIYAVVGVYDNDDTDWLVMGTVYRIEYHASDDSPAGKGTWNTSIYFDDDTANGHSLTVYYYEQGKDDGYPNGGYDRIEHGILYRENSGFKLKTGGINQVDCTTDLVFGTDYFIIPEIIRWKWDYRYRVYFSDAFSGTYSINTKDIIKRNDLPKIQGIQWGDLNPENLILIDPASNSKDNAVNGWKPSFTSKTITKPKILIYGFTKTPRDDNFDTIAIASRVYDKWRSENQIAESLDILYDTVVITGYYDGIETPGNADGAWGSIQGYLTAQGYSSYTEALGDFDVVIIMDNFLEGSSSSPSGDIQYCSWLDEVDYNFLREFKNQSTMIIDKRYGAGAFVWYGGNVPIGDSLLNRGADLEGTGQIIPTDLTHIFGTLYYGGFDYSYLADNDANIFLDENGTTKFNEDLGIDLRIFDNTVDGITDSYDVDLSINKYPIFNEWEQGGSYLNYIPRSDKYRSDDNEILQESKLYIRSYDTEILDSEWEKYEKLGLDNIVILKEDSIIWHRLNSWATSGFVPSITYLGNRQSKNYMYESYNGSEMVLSPLLSQQLTIGEIQYFYFQIPEWIEGEGALQKSGEWEGFRGFSLISEISKYDFGFQGQATGGDNLIYTANLAVYGGTPPDPSMSGWAFPSFLFSTWDEATSTFYQTSKGEGGIIPKLRKLPVWEFKVTEIEKSENGNSIILNVDDTPSPNDLRNVGSSLAQYSGTITRTDFIGRFAVGCIIELEQTISAQFDDWLWLRIADTDYVYYGHMVNSNNFQTNIVTFTFWVKPTIDHTGTYCGLYNDDSDGWKAIFVPRVESAEPNAVYNTPILEVDNEDAFIKISLPRGIDVAEDVGVGYVGIVYCYDTNVLTENDIPINEILGGLKSTASIAEKFYMKRTEPITLPDSTNVAAIATKPLDMVSYEAAYKDKTKEFGFDYNTGLLTSYAFFKDGNPYPPVVVWGGVGEEDIHNMIKNWIGTTISFTNLSISMRKYLYIYYNQYNEMLWINSADAGSEFPFPVKVEDYNIKQIVTNDVTAEMTENYIVDGQGRQVIDGLGRSLRGG
jgi:hypothetical protein